MLFRSNTPRRAASCSKTSAAGAIADPSPYSAEGALTMPYILGGATWSGAAFDPTLGYYIINTTDSGEIGIVRQQDSDPNAPAESPRLFGRPPSRVGARDGGSVSVKGWPCWAPPWGRLTAINVNTGDIAWQIPFGTMEGEIGRAHV